MASQLPVPIPDRGAVSAVIAARGPHAGDHDALFRTTIRHTAF